MKLMNYMNRNGNVVPENDPFTSRIIGLAVQVHSELGPGFIESVYHHAMIVELQDTGIPFKSETALAVTYKGRPVGTFFADIVVEERLLLEFKSVESLLPVHEVQVVNYLKATGLDLSLLLNFGRPVLQIRRKHRKPAKPETPLSLHEV